MAFDAHRISEPANMDRIGEWLMRQVDVVLNTAIATPIEQLARALAPIIVVGLTLQFLFYNMAIMRGYGNMTVTELMWKAMRVALIAGVATAGGFYQTNIVDVMISLPDDVAGIVAGGNTFSDSIDTLRARTDSAAATMEQTESRWYPSSKNILVSIYAGFLTVVTAIISAAVAVLMIVVKVGMALVVAAGPFFIAALAFERTERLFDSWVSQALNFVILALLGALIMSILLELTLSYIAMLIRLLTEGDTSLLSLIAGYFLVGIATIVIIVMLPGLAQSLSSGFGAQFGLGSAGRGAMNAMRAGSLIRKLIR